MGFMDVLGAFVPLIIVVALLYGVLVWIRKYGYNLRGKEIAPVNIKVVSSKMIMPKKYVTVIKVEDKVLILGVSDHSISLLKEIEPDMEVQNTGREESDFSQVNTGSDSFMSILKKNFGMK